MSDQPEKKLWNVAASRPWISDPSRTAVIPSAPPAPAPWWNTEASSSQPPKQKSPERKITFASTNVSLKSTSSHDFKGLEAIWNQQDQLAGDQGPLRKPEITENVPQMEALFDLIKPQPSVLSVGSSNPSAVTVQTPTRLVGCPSQYLQPKFLIPYLKDCGDLVSLYESTIDGEPGYVLHYYDIRHAIYAWLKLKQLNRGEITNLLCFVSPNLLNEPNQGWILIESLPPFFDRIKLEKIMKNFGDVVSMTELDHNRLAINYYDVRDAAYAKSNLHHRIYHGHRLNVMFCDPNVVKMQQEQRELSTFERAMKSVTGIQRQDSVQSHASVASSNAMETCSNVSYFSSGALGITDSGSGILSDQHVSLISSSPSTSTLAQSAAESLTQESNVSLFSSQKTSDVSVSSLSQVASSRSLAVDATDDLLKQSSSLNQIDLYKIINGEDNRTTFMIRNIPNKYTQQMLLDLIDETHKNQYDFVYLRIDFKNRCNVGYAFINFISPMSAVSFALKVCGKKWRKFNSDKICTLSYANIQGKHALIEKFRNSQVMCEDPAYRPKIFYSSGPLKGQEEPFPQPAPQRSRKVQSTDRDSLEQASDSSSLLQQQKDYEVSEHLY